MGLTWALAQKIRWSERRPLRFKMLPKRNRVFCHFFLVILRPEIQSKTYAVCIYMFHTAHLQKKWWIKNTLFMKIPSRRKQHQRNTTVQYKYYYPSRVRKTQAGAQMGLTGGKDRWDRLKHGRVTQRNSKLYRGYMLYVWNMNPTIYPNLPHFYGPVLQVNIPAPWSIWV